MKRTLMIFLLFGLLCQASQRTVVVYVNGIHTTQFGAETTRGLLQARWSAYAATHGLTASSLTFSTLYNHNTWILADLTEATNQLFAQYGTDLTTYYYDQSLIASANDSALRQLAATEANTPASQFNATMLALDNTKSSTPSSLYKPLNDAINRMSRSDYSDLTDLVSLLKGYIQNGNKTVCLGHSQGNFFCNLAYQVIQRDYAGTSYALPNNNVLEVVSVATPASYTADGRFQYVTYCRDWINTVPFSLNANYKNAAELAPCMPRSTSFSSNLLSSVAGLISVIINGGGWHEHDIDSSYLASGSSLLNRVMMQIENTLPDQGCVSDGNCYLKDGFLSGSYDKNLLLTNQSGNSPKPVETGFLVLDSVSSLLFTGELTMRTRRVFTGPFAASFSLYNVGGGKSTIRLKRAVDDSLALALTVYTGSGQNSVSVFPPSSATLPSASRFRDWHELVFTKKDTQVFLTIDSTSVAFNTSRVMDGYYLEIDSLGNNTLEIKDLAVVRTTVTAPPPPTLTPTCSANPAIIAAGQSTVFKGSYTGGTGTVTGVWGGVVSGSGTSATYSTTSSTPAGFYRASYTVTDSGNPKQTASATCSVQVNASTPLTPTITKIGVLGSAVANSPFDILVNGINIVLGQIEAWVFDTGACSAGCRHPDSLLTNVTTTSVTLHNVQLASGDHYLKLRNTQSGAWSNASSAFTVAAASTSGTIAVATSGYIGNISCTLNGSNITAPTTLSNQLAGNYSLVCTPPSGYTISSITPSASQTLSGGGTVKFSVALAVVTATTGTVKVLATMDGKSYTGAMACGFLNSPSNLIVNSVPFSQSNLPLGTYNFACAGGPPNSQLQSISPSASQQLTGGGTITFTAVYVTIPVSLSIAPAGSNSSILQAGTSGGGVTVSATYGNAPANSALAMSLSGLPAYVNAAPASSTVSGSGTATLNTSYTVGSNAQPGTYYPTVTVSLAGVARTLTATLQITPPPTGAVSVGVSGYNGSISCTLNGLSLSAPITLNNQPAGWYTLYCTAPGGYTISSVTPTNSQNLSGGGTISFAVNLTFVPTTVTGYYWNNAPQNKVSFSGNISGTGFVSGSSAVYFCVNNTPTCYQHPPIGVAVNSSISLSVYNVNLTTGDWQVKIVTPYGTGIGPAFHVQ